MDLEPAIRDFITRSESLYKSNNDSVESNRASYDRLCAHFAQPHHPDLKSSDGTLSDIPVRWYWMDDHADSPCIVFFHGGGWVIGGLESHDFFCAKLATDTRCKVVSVDYRLAPEHVFPAGFEDCCAVLKELQSDAQLHSIDPARLVLCGDSAGGNLVAAVALANRDSGGAPLRGQVMIYPALDSSCNTASYETRANAPLLSAQDMRNYWRVYAGDKQPDSAYFSPSLATNSGALPPALLLPVEYDPLRDDAMFYHEKLTAGGTSSELHLGKGLVHRCLRAIETSPGVQLMYRRILEFIETVT